MSGETTYTARWVFPVMDPPLARGTVTVRGDRIAAVEPQGARTPDVDLGNVGLMPGFVNAHTHLDLTGARDHCTPGPDFIAWLRQVIAFRRSQTPEQVRKAIAAGIAQCILSGTTLIGDISSGGASWDLLVDAPVRAVCYYELIGLTRERAEQSWAEAERWLDTHPATPTCRPGLSPHAPYSVRRELFEWAARRAGRDKLPVQIHLAETAEEMELLERRSGPFVEFLREVGAWDPEAFAEPAGIADLYRPVADTAYIHGNFLGETFRGQDVDKLVSCPRTTKAFHRRGLEYAGRRLAFGTDSMASSPNLNILDEARCDLPKLAYRCRELLISLTWRGAWALGRSDVCGMLKPGKSADLVVLPLPDRDDEDPHRLIFDSDLLVRGVMFRGEWVVPP